ncbi:MAG TPA: hypothetical protein VKR41_04255 [Puia sp.]|nr:hypothetical protein [Puia sp.]
MREGLFIKKNIDKWKQYQYEPANDPDEMAGQFTELVNDLGYAKTFYPHSKVTQYLNGLASRIYLGIYRNKKEQSSDPAVLEDRTSDGGVSLSQGDPLFLSDLFAVCADRLFFGSS